MFAAVIVTLIVVLLVVLAASDVFVSEQSPDDLGSMGIQPREK